MRIFFHLCFSVLLHIWELIKIEKGEFDSERGLVDHSSKALRNLPEDEDL